MDETDLVRRARAVFAEDAAVPPPLTLRGANAVDSYDVAEPYDAVLDEPDDAYLEGYAFWGIGYLDARSFRHYLPRLIDYALRTPADRAMVVEALVRGLRPPDRYPPRLAALDAAQEAVVREFLERLAIDHLVPGVEEDAQQALEEWWLPNPRSRPGPEAIAAMRAEPATYKEVGDGGYRLMVPATLTGSGLRDIPQESRRIETWGGALCGDADTVVAVNVKPLAARSFNHTVDELRKLLLDPATPPRRVEVRGARHAMRFDGLQHGDSPAEPRQLAALVAEASGELFILSVHSWPRPDVQRELERILDSFRVID